MTWVAVAIGGAAVIGAGASYAGASKQAKASKQAAGMNMDMFNTLNQQQQPYIQSGYGAMSKLNTLLGLSPRRQAANAPVMSPPMTAGPDTSGYGPREAMFARLMAQRGAGQGQGDNAYMPTPGGGVQPIMQNGPAPARWNVPEANMPNLKLRQVLLLRAQNGDRQAQAMLQRIA